MSTIYIHKPLVSLKGLAVKGFMRLIGFKRNFTNKIKRSNFKTRPAPFPKSFIDKFIVNTMEVHTRKVWEIIPKSNTSGLYIFYLHGGGYVHNISKQHWQFIARLIRDTGAIVIVPDYPLAPETTAKISFSMVEASYKLLLDKTSSEKIILMGDSAGGGFALALAQKLRNGNLPLPLQIILLSPFLDASMLNPEIKSNEKKDPWLSVEGTKIAGKYWAGGLDVKNPLISPIYGSMEDLPQISVFIGGNDILLADNRKLKRIMEESKLPFNYFEYPTMFHVWVLVTILKEAKAAIHQIVEIITTNVKND